MTAGAGVTIEALQHHARAAGLDFGVDWGARGSATVGGAVATNAGGSRVVRYGTMRVAGDGRARPSSPTGQVIGDLRGLPKETVGPHLPSLLCGSEGTLAVITAARLRLVPLLTHDRRGDDRARLARRRARLLAELRTLGRPRCRRAGARARPPGSSPRSAGLRLPLDIPDGAGRGARRLRRVHAIPTDALAAAVGDRARRARRPARSAAPVRRARPHLHVDQRPRRAAEARRRRPGGRARRGRRAHRGGAARHAPCRGCTPSVISPRATCTSTCSAPATPRRRSPPRCSIAVVDLGGHRRAPSTASASPRSPGWSG